MPARKPTARKSSRRKSPTGSPRRARKAPRPENGSTLLDGLESVGAAVETAAGSESEEFFFLYVPTR